MSMKILFVGMHNKPGMYPLDSRTSSGKLVDRCITELKIQGCHAEFWKLNYFDGERIPMKPYKNIWCEDFLERCLEIGYSKEYIIIALGNDVCSWLEYHLVDYIKAKHPAAVRSDEEKESWVSGIIDNLRIFSAKRNQK